MIIIQSGCSSENNTQIKPILNNFECCFEIQDTNISGTMVVDSEYNIFFEILTPDNVYGTKFDVYNEYFTVYVGDISKKYKKQEQDKHTTPYYIHSALKCSESKLYIQNNDTIFINDNCDGGKYNLTFNSLGFVEKIEITNNRQTFIFSNHTQREE